MSASNIKGSGYNEVFGGRLLESRRVRAVFVAACITLIGIVGAPVAVGASASSAEATNTTSTSSIGTAVCIQTINEVPFVAGSITRSCGGTSADDPSVPVGEPADSASKPYWGAPAWRDEFDGTRVDRANWNVRTRADLGLGIDAGIPDAGQVTTSGGLLHIRGNWLDSPQARTPSASGVDILTHKTGYLDQRKLRSSDVAPYQQQYGRWEIRAKVPTGPRTMGALAAFWLRNSQSGEIDIMESWGYGDTPRAQRPGTSTTTVHTKTDGTGVKKFWPLEEELARKNKSAKLFAVHEDFHVWALEYTPTRFTMFYDGSEVFTTMPQESPDFWNPTYFGSPLHVRLNLHVGPSEKYWGIPDPARRELTQPLDFQVDYVRIWAMPRP